MRVYRWGFAAALFLAALPAARADEAPAPQEPAKHQSCFSLREWHGWTAEGDQTLYFKVRMHDVYRIDLASKEAFLNAPGMHLVTISRGSDWICNPIDLDLKIYPGMNEQHSLISRQFFRCATDKPYVRHDLRVWHR